jgi:hypothetical protein
MSLSKRSISKMLGLVENEIDRLDVFIPRDSSELDILLHCREELKVAADSMDETATESVANTAWDISDAAHNARYMRATSQYACDVI